jgi:hypothetical protein
MNEGIGHCRRRRLLWLIGRLPILGTLFLCAGASALWVRSYWRYDGAGTSALRSDDMTRNDLHLASSRGSLLLSRTTSWLSPLEFGLSRERYAAMGGRSGRVGGWSAGKPTDLPQYKEGWPKFLRFGFMWDHQVGKNKRGEIKIVFTAVMVPWWCVVALTGMLPAAWCARRLWMAARARVRRHAGRCAACGYDLRGTPGRCPECGRAAETAPQGVDGSSVAIAS